MYNLTELSNASGIGDLVSVANNFTDGWLMQLLLIVVFIVVILALNIDDFESKIAISSLVSFMLSTMLVYAGWVNYMFPLGFLLILGLALLYMYITR